MIDICRLALAIIVLSTAACVGRSTGLTGATLSSTVAKPFYTRTITSDPPGASVYVGSDQAHLAVNVDLATPTTITGRSWQPSCFRVISRNYLASEVKCLPGGAGNQSLHFLLTPTTREAERRKESAKGLYVTTGDAIVTVHNFWSQGDSQTIHLDLDCSPSTPPVWTSRELTAEGDYECNGGKVVAFSFDKICKGGASFGDGAAECHRLLLSGIRYNARGQITGVRASIDEVELRYP